MIIALIERDNISGLAKEIDLLKDLDVLAFNKLRGKLGRDSVEAINRDNHHVKLSESVLQIFDTPRKTTDVVANTVVEKVFNTNCCSGSSRTTYCFLPISNISHEF